MNRFLISWFLCFHCWIQVKSFSPYLTLARSEPDANTLCSYQSRLSMDETTLRATSTNSNGTDLADGPLHSSRRQAFHAIHSLLTVGTVAAMSLRNISPAHAAADDEATIWISGKAPQVPGQGKSKDKNDVRGTRKDPNFLRSIADCKNQCENTANAEGLARTKEDCLSECQDICCTTYEQCTFNIVPRI